MGGNLQLRLKETSQREGKDLLDFDFFSGPLATDMKTVNRYPIILMF